MIELQSTSSTEKTDADFAVEKAIADMRSNPNYSQDIIGVAKETLTNGYNNHNTAAIQAALYELSTSSVGVQAAKETISAFESGEGNDQGPMTAEDRFAIAAGINDNLSGFESKDAAVSKWAGRVLGQEDGNGVDISRMGVLKGADYVDLSVEQLATQNEEAAAIAVGEGGITPEKAREIIDSDAQYQLTMGTRQIYMDHAKKADSEQ